MCYLVLSYRSYHYQLEPASEVCAGVVRSEKEGDGDGCEGREDGDGGGDGEQREGGEGEEESESTAQSLDDNGTEKEGKQLVSNLLKVP